MLERYCLFYPPLAIGAVLLAPAPLFDDVHIGAGRTVSYGSVFAMAGRPGGDPAVAGIVVLVALVVLLAVVAFWPRPSPGLPAATAVLAAVVAVMLVAKPGTGSPTPGLSYAGTAGLLLMIVVVIVGAAHATHVVVSGRVEAVAPGRSGH
jgi:hypothetical protein